MKTLSRLLFLIAGTYLIVACEKTERPPIIKTQIMESVPFEADFVYNWIECNKDENCCDAFPVMGFSLNGYGTSKNLGELTTCIEFCGNTETLAIENVEGSFRDSNGDNLYYTITGQVRCCNENDPPDILDVLDSKFLIRGGTGRFEGARGEGVYYGCNMYYAFYQEHNPVEASYASYKGTLLLDISKQMP